MRGAEWDEAKQTEVEKFRRLGAMRVVAADDPAVAGRPIVDTMWAGRDKRLANGELDRRTARCVLRGDEQRKLYQIDANHCYSATER